MESSSAVDGEYDVYNFEVKDLHNYFVSKADVLVHNNNYEIDRMRGMMDENDLRGMSIREPPKVEGVSGGARESMPFTDCC